MTGVRPGGPVPDRWPRLELRGAVVTLSLLCAPLSAQEASHPPASFPGNKTCVEALERLPQDTRDRLSAAFAEAGGLPKYWSQRCAAGLSPAQIMKELLPHEALPAREGEEPRTRPQRVVPSAARTSVAAAGERAGKIEAASFFDGTRGGLSDLRGGLPTGQAAARAPAAAARQVMTPALVLNTLERPEFADQKRLSVKLNTEARQDFQKTAGGRALLAAFKARGVRDIPIILGDTENPHQGAMYMPAGKVIVVNSGIMRETYAWAKDKDDLQLSAHLASHPADRRAFLYDAADMLLHESWHAAQFGLHPLQQKYDIPAKDYLPLEYDAKYRGATAFMERVALERAANKDYLLTTDNRYVAAQRAEAVRLAAQGSDAFRRYVRDLYLSHPSDGAMDFPRAIAAQERRVAAAAAPEKKAKLTEGLEALRSAKAYYDAQLPAVARQAAKGSAHFLIDFGMGVAATRPDHALQTIYAGVELIKTKEPKWLEANRAQLRRVFEDAIDHEKTNVRRACGAASPECDQRRALIENACKYIGRDPC